MKVVFFGTPAFAAYQLHYLVEHGIHIAAVVTKPDRPQGRSKELIPSAVKQEALSQNPPLPLFQPPLISAPESAAQLSPFKADLFVVVAFGEIIKENLLNMPKIACINLHASLLPKYRGAAPIQHSIIQGETETGVTVMHMVKKMDAGDIIATSAVPIGSEMTYGELETELCKAGAPLLLKTIRDFENGSAQRTPQDHELATYAPKIELEQCQILWTQPAEQLHNLIRGVHPEPGAWCFIEIKKEKKRLRLLKATVLKERKGQAGEILSASKEGIEVGCGTDALLITQLQLEGKKAMSAEEFLRGVPANAIRFI